MSDFLNALATATAVSVIFAVQFLFWAICYRVAKAVASWDIEATVQSVRQWWARRNR